MAARTARTRESGFTMVELMFALVVIAIFMTAIAMALTTAMKSNRNDTNRMAASNLAATLMDSARATNFETLKAQVDQDDPTTIDPSKTIVNGIQYTAKQTVKWVPSHGTIINCGVGTDARDIAYLRINIAVSWPNMNGIRPVTNSSLVAPPAGQYNEAQGAVASQVTDGAGAPQPGVTATLMQGTTVVGTQLSGDDGCVFFPFLLDGDYTMSVNKTGYVDMYGSDTPVSASTAVVAGPVTSIPPFIYDEAATIRATILPLDGSTVAAAPSAASVLPLRVVNSHIQPTGSMLVTGTGSVLNRTLGSLFPFDEGYSLWPGACINADPDTYLANPGDPSVREPTVTVAPGETSDVTLRLPSLIVKVVKSGVAQQNRQVRLVNVDTTCSTRTITYATTTKTAASTGQVVVSAPYGKWLVQASSSTGTFPSSGGTTVTLSPFNSIPAQTAIVTVTSS